MNNRATLHELQTVYGLEDAHDMLEIIEVQRENEKNSELPEEG